MQIKYKYFYIPFLFFFFKQKKTVRSQTWIRILFCSVLSQIWLKSRLTSSLSLPMWNYEMELFHAKKKNSKKKTNIIQTWRKWLKKKQMYRWDSSHFIATWKNSSQPIRKNFFQSLPFQSINFRVDGVQCVWVLVDWENSHLDWWWATHQIDWLWRCTTIFFWIQKMHLLIQSSTVEKMHATYKHNRMEKKFKLL